jgi:putative endonuclease
MYLRGIFVSLSSMSEKLYYAYIVASRSHNLYVGMTGQIELRIQQHKEDRFDGYSSRYNCNRLVWFERFPYVDDAIAREKQLKGWSRAKKIALIERDNPAWTDLSEEWGKPVKMFGEDDTNIQMSSPPTLKSSP